MPEVVRGRRRVIVIPAGNLVAPPAALPREIPAEPADDDPDALCEWIRGSLIALGLLEQRPLNEWRRVRSGDRAILARPYIPGEPSIVIPKKGGYVVYDPTSLHARAEYISPEQFERDYGR